MRPSIMSTIVATAPTTIPAEPDRLAAAFARWQDERRLAAIRAESRRYEMQLQKWLRATVIETTAEEVRDG